MKEVIGNWNPDYDIYNLEEYAEEDDDNESYDVNYFDYYFI